MTNSAHLHIHKTLVEKAKENNRLAQSQLYELYYKAIFNSSLRIVNDYYVAEDLMQDTFIDAFKNITTLEESLTFGAWLKRIVINKSINHIKKQKLIADKLEDYTVEENENVDEQNWQFALEEIKRGLNQLSTNYRTVFSLYLIEGYDHDEIAQILSIKARTSRSQLSRAKEQLKKIISTQNHQVV